MPRVVVLPSDRSGCGYYRLIHPARVLQQQGADVDVRTMGGGPTVLWDTNWKGQAEPPPSARVVGVEPFDADILVIQRPTRRVWCEAVPLLQAAGLRVVVDVDDLLDALHPRHIGRDAFQARTSPHSNSSWTELVCQQADVVTCSTPALLQRYGYGHGVVLPNLVPQEYLQRPRKDSDALGWSGTIGTHPGDLEVTGGAVGSVLTARPGWRLSVIGDGRGVAQALRAPLSCASGWLPFELYPDALAGLSVGMVPLAPNQFNNAKSCLKMAEMASLGVAPVGSPTPDNLRLNRAGVGLIADSRGAWRRHLLSLTGNGERRREVAGRSREAMAGFTYEGHAGRWWDAWTTLDRSAVTVKA